MMDQLAYQSAIGLAVPWLIERAKAWQRFVPVRYVSTVSRWISVLVAMATAAGFQAAASNSSLCLQVPQGSALIDWAARAVIQYGVHQLTYVVGIKGLKA